MLVPRAVATRFNCFFLQTLKMNWLASLQWAAVENTTWAIYLYMHPHELNRWPHEPLLYCYVRTSWSLTQLSPVPCIISKICATEALPADLLRIICFAFHFATKEWVEIEIQSGEFCTFELRKGDLTLSRRCGPPKTGQRSRCCLDHPWLPFELKGRHSLTAAT